MFVIVNLGLGITTISKIFGSPPIVAGDIYFEPEAGTIIEWLSCAFSASVMPSNS